MRGLLCTVSANGHAAPTTRASMRVIREEQRARGSFAGFDVREILFTDHVGAKSASGERQRRCMASRRPASALCRVAERLRRCEGL